MLRPVNRGIRAFCNQATGYDDQKDIDLIVIGSHTKEKSGKWYAGSAVERVSLRSICPVIVVTDPKALLSMDG
ncbi:MAG: universal stress protein [Bacteroides sp.]|nr:universal stress protein [Bacteroides sp.]